MAVMGVNRKNNCCYSRSDSGEALSPEEEAAGGLLATVARALRSAPAPAAPRDDERSHVSDDNDNSADLLDSETEPCLVTDPGNVATDITLAILQSTFG